MALSSQFGSYGPASRVTGDEIHIVRRLYISMEISNSVKEYTPKHPMSGRVPGMTEGLEEPPRLRFWEIDASFKCPVIGWCLDVYEQRKILKKEGIDCKDKIDFEAHGRLVQSLESENRLSRRLDNWFNRKYTKEVRELSSLEQGEFLRRWKVSLYRGEIEGILWVAVTKRDLCREVMRSIFGDVHMEMHVRAKQLQEERQRFDRERERSRLFSHRLKQVNRANGKLNDELSKARRLSEALQRRNHHLGKELSRVREKSLLAGLQKENVDLRHKIEGLSEQIAGYGKTLQSLKNRNSKLLFKIKQQRVTNSHLGKEVDPIVSQIRASGRDCQSHPPADLFRSRILIVGGLPKMEPRYRQLIEENGGVFEYHDGQVSGGIKELEQQVKRADVVICPTDHNSHGASLAVKRFGRKYRKPIRMPGNSGLTTISQTLLDVRDH